jgi:hypothetical protein
MEHLAVCPVEHLGGKQDVLARRQEIYFAISRLAAEHSRFSPARSPPEANAKRSRRRTEIEILLDKRASLY